MKHFTLRVWLFSLSAGLQAQNTWNRNYPLFTFYSHLLSNQYLHIQDGQNLWVTSRNNTYLFDLKDGEILGRSDFNTEISNLSVRTNPSTGYLFFTVGVFKDQFSKYILQTVVPGAGVVSEFDLIANLPILGYPSAATLSLSDTSFIAFTSGACAKAHFHPTAVSFTKVWEKQYSPRRPLVVVQNTAGKIGLLSLNNLVSTFSNEGDLIWEKTFPYRLRNIKPVNDGWVICGNDSTGVGRASRLDPQGNIIWDVPLPTKRIMDMQVESDGSMAMTGLSSDSLILWLKLSPDGELLSLKTYQTGQGHNIIRSGQGYLILAFADLADNEFIMIQTDETGNAPIVAMSIEENLREINNGKVKQVFKTDFSNTFSINALPVNDTSIAYIGRAGFAMAGYTTNGELKGKWDINGWGTKFGLRNHVLNDFKRAWAVKKSEVEALRNDFADNGVLDNKVPRDILEWPAKNNPNYRYRYNFAPVQTLAARFIAPFWDVNNDGNYNVFDGDFPRIKGDMMGWWVTSDTTYPFKQISSIYGEPLNLDAIYSAYIFQCTGNDALNSTIFTDINLINKSLDSFDGSLYFGSINRETMSCYTNTRFGTLPEERSFYLYNNVSATDSVACSGGYLDYNNLVASVTTFNQDVESINYYNNIFGPIGTQNPESSEEILNLMKGLWPDGAPYTYGGYGRGGGTPVKYVFTGNPAQSDEWSMCSENTPFEDRYILTSTGGLSFFPQDTLTLRLATTLHFDVPTPCPDLSAKVRPNVQQLIQADQQGWVSASGSIVPIRYMEGQGTITLDAHLPGATAWQWSTGATTATVLVSQPGDYMVTISNQAGCPVVERITVKAGFSGVQHINQPAFAITTAPVPAVESCLLTFNAPVSGDLRIFNAQGQLVKMHHLSDTKQFNLDVSALTSGVYWLTVQTPSGHVHSGKIVVM
ncbi:MAG: T9SS type A sorting domain-containing protein [Saprospiraceae bacterium]|nr:T9SS type A sorting domain-containing protein [Saprospiraceae bacterium]